MRHIVRKYKMFMYKIMAYRPQSNGSIEHSHYVLMESKTMITKIKKLKQICNTNDESAQHQCS